MNSQKCEQFPTERQQRVANVDSVVAQIQYEKGNGITPAHDALDDSRCHTRSTESTRNTEATRSCVPDSTTRSSIPRVLCLLVAASDQQNSMLDSISGAMHIAGLTTETLNYTMLRWDPRWWSLKASLHNGTEIGFSTTGYYPYSGDSGAAGVTGKVRDAGSYAVNPNTEMAMFSSLDFSGLAAGSIAFFDNPTATKNYSLPDYSLFGTSRNIPNAAIPELGNLTNPHWISAKALNFTHLNQLNVSAVVLSWVDTSDENAALQWLPASGPPKNEKYHCPTLYVGNSTGESIRSLIKQDAIDTMTLVLDAPSIESPTYTLISHLKGTKKTKDSILLYTHSDGPSIIEENGPIMMLTLAEYFTKNAIGVNLDFVMTTGHLSGGKLNESAWMSQKPELMANARTAICLEHLGAIEWKDRQTPSGPVYEATGRLEPMWTFANDSDHSADLRQVYLDSFDGTPDYLRMALLDPLIIDGNRSAWYGVGGSSTLGYSKIPTVGIIPQPDYLWASMIDGGWSKFNESQAVAQLEVLIKVILTMSEHILAGS